MPLTPFQTGLLTLLAANRSPESFVAGGIALNVRASDADVATLEAAGYSSSREVWTPSFRRAWITRGEEGVRLEWCYDSAWRFFPIEPDALLGWKLHWFDALTNKALAMGGRAETRDLVDIVNYAARCPLHAVIWAACSKDPGFGPLLLLSQMQRHSRVDPADLRAMGASMEPQILKSRWLDLAARAEVEIERAGTARVEVGLAFVHESGAIGWFDDSAYVPHRATLRGALPRIVGERS
ncbi:MAG TPA: hypothetical protein VI485_11535 [Vicinamibacterales bacterium]|nr:hypothetical protein [Vicinamibacterales bacterium]